MQRLFSKILCCLFTAIACCGGGLVFAQEQPEVEAPAAEKPAKAPRFGQFLTLTSPIGDAQVARVGNLAMELQAKAEREDREAVLILEIPSGASRFGQVSDLARKLTSADASRVRTVAWIPKTVHGYHAMIALACHDIVMDPDAALGDIGRGAALPKEEQELILSISDRRRNSRLSRGVVLAMMDPAVELLRVKLDGAAGFPERQLLTPQELKIKRDNSVAISETQKIKNAGAPGSFNASDALRSGFLVAKTVKTRRDVARLYDLPTESMRERSTNEQPVKARMIALHEAITPLTREFIQRQIRTSVADGANVLIFDIDSPGGYLDASVSIANSIAELDPAKVTTVAWISDRALSGAAVVALGTDRIIMKPDAHLGDAGVIREVEEGGAFERVPEKLWSDFLVTLENLAERKNRPADLLKAMVDKNLQVYQVTHPDTGRVTYMSQYGIDSSNEAWIKGPVVEESREDVLLTINGKRAHELGLADKPCEDFDELRIRLGIPENNRLVPIARTWVDTFVWVLNSQIAGFGLITLAILCMYMEAHLPSGIFGIVALILFALFFWSRYLGGTSGSLELIMFVLGVVLLALEIFVVPGFGVFGVSGLLLMGGSLIMASHTFAGMTAGERFDESMSSLGSLAGALATVIVVAVTMNRFLPSIPFLNRLILTPPGYAAGDDNAPHLNPAVFVDDTTARPVKSGDVGMTASTLRPSGKATFGDLFLDVVSDGGYIDHGKQVEVIRVTGSRIIVRPAAEESDVT